MAPKARFRIFFLLLSLKCCLSRLERRVDYEEWISWNVRKYEKMTMVKGDELSNPAPPSGRNVLDENLRMAEMNVTRKSVGLDGSGDYKTIKEAIGSIPLFNSRRVILEIKPGIYREKISIPRTLPYITLLGDWRNPPTITGNDTASTITRRNGKPLKTFQSSTVSIDANYFIAISINFENTAPHVIGSKGEQAVALRISGTKSAFYNCSFFGSQDTLYDHRGLHYFNNCFIQGSVDFIFGYGRSLYENCNLNSVTKKVASLTAQKRTNSSLASGFSFKDSIVTGSGQVYLGRAWGDYSRVVFSYTFMDKIVHPKGWSDWGDKKRDSRVYYGEYKCTGPGANLTGRVPWIRVLSYEEALPFIGTYYIEGNSWLISPS